MRTWKPLPGHLLGDLETGERFAIVSENVEKLWQKLLVSCALLCVFLLPSSKFSLEKLTKLT